MRLPTPASAEVGERLLEAAGSCPDGEPDEPAAPEDRVGLAARSIAGAVEVELYMKDRLRELGP
jgi:hypothetical protein